MTFFNPVKPDDKAVWLEILSTSKKLYEKKLAACNKKVDRYSDKLKASFDRRESMKRRSSARIDLNVACEERDGLKRKLTIIDNQIFKLLEG